MKQQLRSQYVQPVRRKRQTSAKRRPIQSVTSILMVVPHGYCQQTRLSVARLFVDTFQVAIGPAEPEDGTMEANWVLASDTGFAATDAYPYCEFLRCYRADVRTPGFRSGGALPVELSHFRPARDKVTDAVVITWSDAIGVEQRWILYQAESADETASSKSSMQL